jgi:hypothetical protein
MASNIGYINHPIEGFIIGASVISIFFILVIIFIYIRIVLKLEKDAHCNNSDIQTAQCEQQKQYQKNFSYENQFDFFIQKDAKGAFPKSSTSFSKP